MLPTDTRIADIHDLNQRIRDHGSPDPGVVAAAILAADLTIDELRIIAAAGLRDHVRGILARPDAVRRRGRSGTENTPPGTNPSRRVQRLIDHYREALAAAVYSADGEWRTLGDCRAEHLRYAAKGRREKAEAVLVEADRYDRIADALDTHGVDTVAELPRQIAEPLIC